MGDRSSSANFLLSFFHKRVVKVREQLQELLNSCSKEGRNRRSKLAQMLVFLNKKGQRNRTAGAAAIFPEVGRELGRQTFL